MNIIHIITSLESGGAEATLYQLITNDKINNHVVISLTGLGKYGPLLQEQGIPTYSIDFPKGSINLRGLLKIFKTIKKHRNSQIIQTWMYHSDFLGSIFGKLFRIPVYWGIHNTILDSLKSSKSAIILSRLCAKISSFSPKRIIACAESAKSHHVKIGYCSNKFTVIPNGYDTQRFKPNLEKREKIRREFNIPKNILVFSNVARFDPYKDHDNLLHALSLLAQRGIAFRALLTGSGITTSNKELEEIINKYNIRNHLILTGPRNDVESILNASDFHILSSSAEAFPNVLAEAMSCGIPCITTDVGDAKHIIGNNGWIATAKNPQILFEKILLALSAMNDEKKFLEIKKECRESIETRYSIKIMLENYSKSWHQ